MLRFKLRTLLIVTALIGLFLGLQVHVQLKAKRFVDEMSDPSMESKMRLVRDASISIDRSELEERQFKVESVFIAPTSLEDIFLVRRQIDVFVSNRGKDGVTSMYKIPIRNVVEQRTLHYHASLSGLTRVPHEE